MVWDQVRVFALEIEPNTHSRREENRWLIRFERKEERLCAAQTSQENMRKKMLQFAVEIDIRCCSDCVDFCWFYWLIWLVFFFSWFFFFGAEQTFEKIIAFYDARDYSPGWSRRRIYGILIAAFKLISYILSSFRDPHPKPHISRPHLSLSLAQLSRFYFSRRFRTLPEKLYLASLEKHLKSERDTRYIAKAEITDWEEGIFDWRHFCFIIFPFHYCSRAQLAFSRDRERCEIVKSLLTSQDSSDSAGSLEPSVRLALISHHKRAWRWSAKSESWGECWSCGKYTIYIIEPARWRRFCRPSPEIKSTRHPESHISPCRAIHHAKKRNIHIMSLHWSADMCLLAVWLHMNSRARLAFDTLFSPPCSPHTTPNCMINFDWISSARQQQHSVWSTTM